MALGSASCTRVRGWSARRQSRHVISMTSIRLKITIELNQNHARTYRDLKAKARTRERHRRQPAGLDLCRHNQGHGHQGNQRALGNPRNASLIIYSTLMP